MKATLCRLHSGVYFHDLQSHYNHQHQHTLHSNCSFSSLWNKSTPVMCTVCFREIQTIFFLKNGSFCLCSTALKKLRTSFSCWAAYNTVWWINWKTVSIARLLLGGKPDWLDSFPNPITHPIRHKPAQTFAKLYCICQPHVIKNSWINRDIAQSGNSGNSRIRLMHFLLPPRGYYQILKHNLTQNPQDVMLVNLKKYKYTS